MTITTNPPSFGVRLSSALFGIPVYNDLVNLDTRLTMVDTPYQFRLNNSGTTCNTGADTKLTWTTNISSSGVTVTTLNRVTLNRAGRWQLRLNLAWSLGGTVGTQHFGAIRRYNASNVLQEVISNGIPSFAGAGAVNNASGSMICAATDYLEAWAFQASTVNKGLGQDANVGVGGTMFEGYWEATA